jgi:hypothetical protein
MKVMSIHEHVKVGKVLVPELGQPGLSTVTSSASDQPALHRICGAGIGFGALGIFRLSPQSVVSKSGFRKAAPPSGPWLGLNLDSRQKKPPPNQTEQRRSGCAGWLVGRLCWLVDDKFVNVKALSITAPSDAASCGSPFSRYVYDMFNDTKPNQTKPNQTNMFVQ